jgi:hypothetical protein
MNVASARIDSLADRLARLTGEDIETAAGEPQMHADERRWDDFQTQRLRSKAAAVLGDRFNHQYLRSSACICG